MAAQARRNGGSGPDGGPGRTVAAPPPERFAVPAETAVEIAAPDLSPWRRGNTGIDFVSTWSAGRPGPHVMVSAVVHGNELCGAIAVDELLRAEVRPSRGRLTLAFMNAAACERFDPAHPALGRYLDEDFNRLWSAEVLDGPRDSVELRRAREVRPVVDEVDYLLDLHSMQYGSTPLALCGSTDKGRDFARELGLPAHVVRDAGHAAGARLRDYAAFADGASPRNALLVECGQHWKRATVDVARRVARRFLARFEVALPPAPPEAEAGAGAEHGPAEPAAGNGEAAERRLIEVTQPITVRSHRFRFSGPFLGMEVIAKAGTVIGYDGDDAVATPHDDCVLIMPSHRAARGATAVRFGRFVE